MGRFASACVRRARRSVGWWRWPWFGRMQQMKVIVLGTGAIGAYYGAQLARAGHAVTCFARGANLGAIQERGLEVWTPEGGFRAAVTATDRAEALAPADLAILAVKSYSLVDIAPIMGRCAEQETTVVPLLNGVETVQRLEQLGVPPAAPLGRRLLQRAIEEIVAVGRARGIGLPEEEVARVLGVIDGLPPAMKPSFLADLEPGGPTELDILSGAVSRFAEEAGIATPIHDTAAAALAHIN